ncbi:MAG: caspase family protein, partial [Oligoflexales bacterium]|nr:caspase family protein [Oligoflexales bacterium]
MIAFSRLMFKIVFIILPFVINEFHASAGERYALIVSNNDGGSARARLRYANRDAKVFAEALQSLAIIPKKNLHLVQNVKRGQLIKEIENLVFDSAPGQGKTAQFIFYYSGHSDDEGLLLGEERFLYAELKRELERLPAKARIIILDSCSSGALTLTKGGERQKPFLNDVPYQASGYAIITSSSFDESSQESDRMGGSFFT